MVILGKAALAGLEVTFLRELLFGEVVKAGRGGGVVKEGRGGGEVARREDLEAGREEEADIGGVLLTVFVLDLRGEGGDFWWRFGR